MKVLFAVSDESVSESIIKKYQQMYKEIIISKNVYYFNAIIKELQKDKTYDRVVISEDLEPFANNNYEAIDNFIFEKLDNISDEAVTNTGDDTPIILITTDRRTKSDNLLIKLFGILKEIYILVLIILTMIIYIQEIFIHHRPPGGTHSVPLNLALFQGSFPK